MKEMLERIASVQDTIITFRELVIFVASAISAILLLLVGAHRLVEWMIKPRADASKTGWEEHTD
jgi:hypothetical protein